VKCVVVGAGAWGSAFAKVLRDRGHDVDVARRQTVDDQPYEDAELVAIAVPSSSFRDALAHVRGSAPVLGLTKGLDPETGARL
jgi:glycerol-3-phosphate dehydrogenase